MNSYGADVQGYLKTVGQHNLSNRTDVPLPPAFTCPLAAVTRATRPEDFFLGWAFHGLGNLYLQAKPVLPWNPFRASSLYHCALNVYAKTIDSNDFLVANVYFTLGELYRRNASDVFAEWYLAKAIKIANLSTNRAPLVFAEILEGNAKLASDLGKYAKAIDLMDRIPEIIKGKDGAFQFFPRLAITRAKIVIAAGDWRDAFAQLQSIEEFLNHAETTEGAKLIPHWAALANCYLDIGEEEKASDAIDKASALGLSDPDRNWSKLRTLLMAKIKLSILRHQSNQSRAFLDEVDKIDRKNLEGVGAAQAERVRLRSMSYLDEGNCEAARLEYRKADTASSINLATILLGGDSYEKRRKLTSAHWLMDLAISLQFCDEKKSEEFTRFAFDSVLRRKAISFEVVRTHFDQNRKYPDDEKRFREELAKPPVTQVHWESFGNAFKGMSRASNGREIVAIQGELLEALRKVHAERAAVEYGRVESGVDQGAKATELESEGRLIEAELSATIGPGAIAFNPAVDRDNVNSRKVQAALPEGTVLFEYVAYQRLDARAGLTQKELKPDRYGLFILTNRSIDWIDCGLRAPIDENILRLQRTLQEYRKAPQDILARLYKQVFRDAQRKVHGVNKILIAPDGELNLLPFSALIDEKGQYLIDDFVISELSSGRAVLNQEAGRISRKHIILMGGLDYEAARMAGQPISDSPELRSDTSALRFSKLKHTHDEVSLIAKLLAASTPLTEMQATETKLKNLSRPSMLLIASHGFFRPKPAALANWDPLLSSGIALSGANERTSGIDDGILTAREAGDLDLRGTELVVLSACQTGTGDTPDGEVVQGLRWGFELAGARSQITTLWNVADRSTSKLMVAFYENLIPGKVGRAEALRDAQRQLSRPGGEFSDPFFWGGFVAYGNWGPIVFESP